MKTKLSVLLVALLATTVLFAYDFQSGDLYYNITSDTTVEVTNNNYSYTFTSVEIPTMVTYNGTNYNVTGIGPFAFGGSTNLTSITIPDGITVISKSAFQFCTGLTSVTIPNSVTSIGKYAFYNCTGLTSVTIPDGVTSIGDCAFYLISNIVYNGTATGTPWGAKYINGYVDDYFVYADETKTSLLGCSSAATGDITIPDGVTSIGDAAFYLCLSITSITIPESVIQIGTAVFRGTDLTSIVVESGNTIYDSRNSCNAIIETATNTLIQGCKTTVIPNSVTSIGGYAFSFTSLTSISISDGVTTIGEYAFSYCDSLTSVSIGNSVTKIGDGAFEDCRSLSSIIIPESVTIIGNYAFAGCYDLASVTIGNSVEIINLGAFQQCRLTSIVVESGNTKYDSRNNCNAIIETATNTLIQGCKTTVIPNSVTSIGKHAFSSTLLISISIPNSVTSIGVYAFYNCTSLTSVTIPNSVTTIRSGAFWYCTALTEITCYATAVPETATNAFSDVNKSAKLYVPKESVADYKAHPVWGQFDLILPLSTINIHDDSATGNKNTTSQKFFHNGLLYIRHGDKTYTPAGIEL